MSETSADRLAALADAAGASVTQHVHALLEAAMRKAEEVEVAAAAQEEAADRVLRETMASAANVLHAIRGVEGRLGDAVDDLRSAAGDELEAQPAPAAAAPPANVDLPVLREQVAAIAANLEAVMRGGRASETTPKHTEGNVSSEE